MRLPCLFAFLWLCVASAHAGTRPNVLLILADDMGWGDVHSHGNSKIDTPVLDKLAEDGARFDRFFVMPVCAPTRAGLLTGRYHLRGGVHGVTRGYEDLREDETTFAQVFKQAGYATGLFGKWHNGAHAPRGPNGKGFDEFLGFCAGHWNNYHDPVLQHNDKMEPQKGYITDVLTDAALKFIDGHRKDSWLCYVPYNVPHTPWQAPEDLWQKYKARGLATEEEACAYAMVERMDWNIGRLLAKLKDTGLAENTIVIFLSDNGPNTARYNGDMRGRKGMVHEGGVRVPFFIHWPGHLKERVTVPQIACCVDVLPTLCEICGVAFNPDADHALDGLSLAPLLTNVPVPWPDRYLFTHQAGAGLEVTRSKGAVRSEKYRAVLEPAAGPRSPVKWQLYDLENDPSQKTDIAHDYPDILAPMTVAYDKWFADATKRGFEPLPIPVGVAGHAEVLLQGHQAFLQTNEDEGGIAYHNKNGFANDWIAQWTDPKAYAHWHVDVRKAGRYEAFVDYTCPATAVGSKLAVEMAGKTLVLPVDEAFDPPPVPDHDLISRRGTEPDEKPWKRASAGVLDLPAGTTDLLLKLAHLQGPSGPEVKAVMLRAVQP